MISHSFLAAIAVHTQTVERGEANCTVERCPTCGRRPAAFKYHATRKRTFRVIVDRMVQTVVSALTRWKCPACRETFTLYPDFALPHKRYVRQDVCRLSERYVTEDDPSYRKAVQVNGTAVYYDAGAGGRQAVDNRATAGDSQAIDDRTLWPSTLHRWIGWVGGLRRTLREAFQLIRARSATCDVHRDLVPLAPGKYRGEQRKAVLQACGRLFRTDEAYRNLFQTSIFPDLATVCGWS